MSAEFEVIGTNQEALFTLKVHRGEGMALLGMNWRNGRPPNDFVGFAIEYAEPAGTKFFPLKNRLAFPGNDGSVNPNTLSTLLSPIQKFRWVHFPRNAELPGAFTYKVTPVFMDTHDVLSYGKPQVVAIELRRETYPNVVNVAFTRGFISSQAFVDRYGLDALNKLIPAKADQGLDFKCTYPSDKAPEAYAWMGFEARSAILEVLDQAIADPTAKVRVVAYDLNDPEIVSRLERLGKRVKVIIDDDGDHGLATSCETAAATRLAKSAGKANVKRQHLGKLQHNKTIVVDGQTPLVVCGSTNFSWRGIFVQNNNAIIFKDAGVMKIFRAAFDDYWASQSAADFGSSTSATWHDLGLAGISVQAGFSPRAKKNAVLKSIAADIANNTTSDLFYSLAFLYETPGPIRDAIVKHQKNNDIFSYGISDKKVGGLDVQKPDGTVRVIYPKELSAKLPSPFKEEPTGAGGARLHHKFVVIDFEKPTARVYVGSFNFSSAADITNGENLLLIRDPRIARSYMIEALRIFDHYEFRVVQSDAKKARKKLQLAKPPRQPGEQPWWLEDYTDKRKIRDREIFS